ncbi:hypothetical protein QLX08_001274 [Tetragonisca angustula]|uniref:Integrase catalytic domain-containing protein n=1 Tax=Tetragonisca angustula TaxID=166442 RepID=A0AAW1AFE6_9HYME
MNELKNGMTMGLDFMTPNGRVECLKEFMAMAERQSDNKIMALRIDNGREYVNHELRRFLKQKGP